MNRIPIRSFLLAGTIALAPCLAFAQTTLLDDSFADGNRSGQNLTSSSAWFGTSGATTLTATTGAMTLATGTSGRGAVTYFTTAGSPQALGIGETITAQLSFTVTGPLTTTSTNTFRLGLLNSSDGTRISTDNHGTAYLNYTGYVTSFSLNSTADLSGGAISVHEKLASSNTNIGTFGTGGANYASLGTDGPSANPGNFTLSADTAYVATFSITRTGADSLNFASSITGGSFNSFHLWTITDPSASALAFDTFAFHVNSNTVTTTVVSNALITHAIPEPSTYALIFGGLALAGVIVRRRMHRTA